MRIALLVEGQTEKAFLPSLRRYLARHLPTNMPRLEPCVQRGRLPRGAALKKTVEQLLNHPRNPVDHVIALTDVYTGDNPPIYSNAADAKAKMREWVGKEKRFHPHAAQYDFEAWLIPYWGYIQKMAGHNQSVPSSVPEQINHGNPPGRRMQNLFQVGTRPGAYVKRRDAARILDNNDLGIAVAQCPELKSLINTILTICGAAPIP